MAENGTDERRARIGDPARPIALADGVFAIVMTLLVLDLRIPAGLGEMELRQELVRHLPSLLAYVFAFLLAGEYWIGHRATFVNVHATNLTIILLNVGMLLLVALIPFAAGLIGNYPLSRTALGVYGGLLMLLEVYRFGMWLYISMRPAALVMPMPPLLFRRRVQVMAVELAAFALALALLPVLPPLVVLFVYGIMPLAFFGAMVVFSRRITGRG